jgi:thiopurine S-methyltransferase
MTTDWLSRWESGHIGWHQTDGSAALRKFWPGVGYGNRVLVPLCGKSPDLLWLAQQGCDVTGVELSEIAVRAFFDEAGLKFGIKKTNGLKRFQSLQQNITIACGDYFRFSDKPFDALYDRASLVALPPQMRPKYIQHTKTLLKADATQLLLTLEYDQSKANGPPFCVEPDEVKSYWDGLRRVGDLVDTKKIPPKFRDAGISEVVEAVWVTTQN